MRLEKWNMADQTNKRRSLSLDGWAVLIALLLAGLVRLGIIPHVGW